MTRQQQEEEEEKKNRDDVYMRMFIPESMSYNQETTADFIDKGLNAPKTKDEAYLVLN